MVEVAEVEDLQVEPADAGGLTPASDPVGDLGGRAGQAVIAQLANLPADRLGTTRDLGVVPADAGDEAAERMTPPGSRPTSAQAAATRSKAAAAVATSTNGTLNSVAKRAASTGVRRAPVPPMTIGMRSCTGFGSAGESARR